MGSIFYRASARVFLVTICLLEGAIASEADFDATEAQSSFEQIRKSGVQLDLESDANLRIAESSIKQDPEIAKAAASEFISHNLGHLSQVKNTKAGDPQNSDLADFAIDSQVETARQLYSGFVRSTIEALEMLNQAATKTDILTSVDHRLSFRLNPILKRADLRTLGALQRLQDFLHRADGQNLIAFRHQRSSFIYLYKNFLEAKSHRLPSAADWAAELDNGVSNFISGHTFLNWKQSHQKLLQIFEDERQTEVFRAWVNRDTITASAMAAVVAAQGVCIFVTVGICAATLPATSSWVVTGGRIALGVAQAEVTTISAINLIDKYRFEGISGLLSVGSAIDALILVAAIPAPGLRALESATTISFFGRTIETANIAARFANLQLKSLVSLSAISGAYGSWQLVKAEEIAKRLQSQGQTTSANEVRMQGATHLMMALFGGFRAYNYYASTLKESPSYQRYAEAKGSMGSQYLESLKRFTPQKSFGNIINGVRQMPADFWSGIKTTGVGLGYLTYQTVFTGALALASYTYPDFVMEKRNKALPELREGESALLLNGFSSNDILYYAFASDYANRHEIAKYQNKLGAAFFETPTDLFRKIEEYAAKNGKIRYLKIMAHGVPGRIVPLATQDVMEGEERGLIDAKFIEENRDFIRKIARSSMAPDGQIVIISCLVGANLKKATDYRDIHFEEKSGDHLMQALGKNLLLQGGSIDSSRRIIMGAEGAFGSLWDHAIYESMIDLPIKQEIEAYNVEVQQAFDGQKSPSLGPITATMAERLLRMYSHIWSVVYKFGYNLEGNFFSDRHRHDDFPAEVQEAALN